MNREAENYDVVYFVKDASKNEELIYSLRSLEQNWQYKSLVIYGGKPDGIKPDRYVHIRQTAPTKWERVRSMLYQACDDEQLTENFWLFNDDFFVLKPMPLDFKPQYDGTLDEKVAEIERKYCCRTVYTRRLRHLIKTLENAKKGGLNYAVHKPMLINRKKMIEVLNEFPDEPMFRALYGNYWQIGGENKPDTKIALLEYDTTKVDDFDFVSTSDDSWGRGAIGEYLRNKFNEPSRFEEVCCYGK